MLKKQSLYWVSLFVLSANNTNLVAMFSRAVILKTAISRTVMPSMISKVPRARFKNETENLCENAQYIRACKNHHRIINSRQDILERLQKEVKVFSRYSQFAGAQEITLVIEPTAFGGHETITANLLIPKDPSQVPYVEHFYDFVDTIYYPLNSDLVLQQMLIELEKRGRDRVMIPLNRLTEEMTRPGSLARELKEKSKIVHSDRAIQLRKGKDMLLVRVDK